ncbi:MAG: trypsin-like peptidase domain-containing protein [Anaerolineae bacterium]|nr:trypsin-like peptidase domain-containing protein [Anaerolineae bacterium]
MKKYRALIIAILFVLIAGLACGPDGETLPTVTPIPTTSAPPTTAPPTAEPDGIPTPEPLPDDRQVRQNLLRSTVQILALIEYGGQLQPIWTGSGTIISPDGLILTNAHVVTDPDPNYQPDALGISITVCSDDLPELRYLGEILAVDTQLDLAVIRIATDLDGRPVNVEALSLNYVEVGNSDAMDLGDLIQILGYPGIGGETITFTEGVVSGFTRERGVDGRAFIKTDATIAGGNSGGLGANASGQIIGVPTQVGYGGAERFADCRYLADTNGDGRIDENDNCIPVGGFINALRPVNLAAPLIEAARMGGVVPGRDKGSGPTTPSTADNPEFYGLVFAPGVTDNDQPTQIVSQLPSGATGLYAFWEYNGMADGVTWEARWYHDGEYMSDVSWPPAPWQGGEQGSWWIGIVNDSGITDGTYRVELYVEEELLAQSAITVGGSASDAPTFNNLVFSDGVTAANQPSNPTYLLPSGITDVYAFFDYANMRDGMGWERRWYYEGENIATGADTWDEGPSGSTWAGLSADSPLDPGSYRLELYVEGTLLAAANFTVAGTSAESAFGAITFAPGIDAVGQPVNPGNSFPSGTTELYFFCDYAGLQNGLYYEERWLLNGEELVVFDGYWEWGESGYFHDLIYLTSGEPLWDGEYTIELYIEGQLVQYATAVIGTGSPPPPPPPPAEGLYITGYILDADNNQGIVGAYYIVLQPGVTTDTWDGSDRQIYTWAESGSSGYFELPDPLLRGETYSIIVLAEDYLPAWADGLLVGDESSPLEVEILLQHD